VLRPLFPGYLFLMIKLQWHAAKVAPGVTRLVMDGLTPARVPDRVIEELRRKERNGVIELPKPPPRLCPGGRVKVVGGPLKGLQGLCEADRFSSSPLR
jgi:transcriptional antiterminator RfaH